MHQLRKNKLQISIILPTYNCEYTLRSIKSVINQTYKSWELIVIDNYSKNNIKEKVTEFNDSRIKYFKIKNRGIIAKSRNLGIKKSKFSWIAFLDSDDYWSKNKLAYVVKNIQNYKQDLYYHHMWIHYSNNKTIKKKLYNGNLLLNKPIFDNLILNGNKIPQSSVVVKKSLVKKVGYLSEKKDFVTWEDFDLWIKISKITNKFYCINIPLGFYWVNDEKFNKLKNYIKIIKSFELYYKNEINIIKKQYKIKNLDWINQAKSKFYMKLKKYDSSLKYLSKFNKKSQSDKVKYFMIKFLIKINNLL